MEHSGDGQRTVLLCDSHTNRGLWFSSGSLAVPGGAEKTFAEEGKFGLGLCFSGGGKREGHCQQEEQPIQSLGDQKGLASCV